MKTKFTQKLFAIMLMLFSLLPVVNAQDASFTIASTVAADYFKAYPFSTVSSPLSIASSSGDMYVSLGSTPSNAGSNYIDVTTTLGTIDSISFFVTGNGANKTITPAILAWSGVYSSTAADYAFTNNTATYVNKGIAYATWMSYDMSGKNIKQARIYRAVKGVTVTDPAISSTQTIGAAQTVQFYGIKVYIKPSGPQAPKVSALSIDGANGTFANDSTIKVNLPYASYAKGQPVATSLISATTDSSAVTTTISNLEFTATLTSFNVGDTIVYNVEKGGLSKNYYVITSADVPSPTCTSPANASQSVKAGVAISPIVFATTNASSVVVTGLPSNLSGSLVGDVFTITGTPAAEASYPATYTYTVKVDSLPDALGSPIIKTGTITVKDPAAKTVAFVYNAATANTPLYNELNAHYDVTVYSVSSSDADTVATSAYMTAILANDLIVIHELPSSGNITMSALGKQIGKKPILNTKTHMYGKPSWPAGSGNNGVTGDTCVYVSTRYKFHPIFTSVTFKNDSVVDMATGTGLIRGATGTAAETATKFDIAKSKSTGISIIETNDVPSAKYMMIGLAATSETLSSNGLQVLKNACDYLMGSTVFAPAASQEAAIKSFKIGTVNGVINEGAKTISITLPKGTAVTSLSPVVVVSDFATITAPASLTAVDFTNSVDFTIQAEDILVSPVTYAVTVSIALGTDTTLSALTVSEGTLSPAFNPAVFAYSVVLPAGSTTVPTVSATSTDASAGVVITDATALPGMASVVVTSEDAANSATYTIDYTVATGLSEAQVQEMISVKVGEIVINNAVGAKLTISSISGLTLYSGVIADAAASYKLGQGMYVVSLDGTAIKVLVK